MVNIYKITNRINNKIYIGKTSLSIEERFKQHCDDSKKPHCKNRAIYRAMNKYGIENFTIELICQVETEEEASQMETYYIAKYNTYGHNSNGYNQTVGGEGRPVVDKEMAKKLFDDGHECNEIARIMKCDRDTISSIIRSYGINPRKNCTSKKSRPVIMCDKDTHKPIRVFESQSDAANYILNEEHKGTSIKAIVTKIGDVANGYRKSAYGYYWEFVNEIEPEVKAFKAKVA